jgi:hypothetical protein
MKTPLEKSSPPVTCRYLRSKHMYVPVQADAASSAHISDNDQAFYWCNRTLGALGVDDDRVHPCVCLPGRSCHEA